MSVESDLKKDGIEVIKKLDIKSKLNRKNCIYQSMRNISQL